MTPSASLAGTFSVADSVELAVVTRGGFVESRHAGSAVVLSPEGEALVSLGSPESRFYTRSALKPLQSLTMHSLGLTLDTDEERAISLASHNGTPEHVAIVMRMLAAGRLTPDALQCPADWPMGGTDKLRLAASGGIPAAIHHCCSGKHAAMLRTCQINGWSLDTYLDPSHPLQQAIKETVQRFTGEIPNPISIDGCGAPTHAITLTGLARGIRRMATAELNSPFPLHRQAASLIASARKNGWVVCGAHSGDTVLIDKLGVFSKFGAEGSVVVATPDGHVAVVKILDGSQRALHVVAAELLAQVGAISRDELDRTLPQLRLSVFGGGQQVGAVTATC